MISWTSSTVMSHNWSKTERVSREPFPDRHPALPADDRPSIQEGTLTSTRASYPQVRESNYRRRVIGSYRFVRPIDRERAACFREGARPNDRASATDRPWITLPVHGDAH